MNTSVRLLVIVCTLSIGLGLPGCSPTPGKSWRIGSGSASRNEGGVAISYTVQGLTCDGRMYFVVAANGCTGSAGGGSGNSRGQLHTRDGREIVWTCATQDGKSGKVVIDGQEFNLNQGALFLASTKEKPTRVEQVVIETGQLQAESIVENLPELAKADPRIATFLQSCKDGE
jgi:hypothetical protein